MTDAVSPTYVHGDKLVTPGPRLDLPGRQLKWYQIATSAFPVPSAIDEMARTFLTEDKLEGVGPLGFVILHRCGHNFYFLIVCSWQGENEIWETVFAIDKGMRASATGRGRARTCRPSASGRWARSRTRAKPGAAS